MDEQNRFTTQPGRASSFTLRDLLRIGFHRKRLVVRSFLGIFLVVVFFVLLRPARYEAQMKILLKRERVDPVVTSEVSPQRHPEDSVSEERLNSEVELLRSRDLLEKVVVACGLHERLTGFHALLAKFRQPEGDRASRERRIARTVSVLEKDLEVQPLKKTSLIKVTYQSPDPGLSMRVLKTVADLYLEQHLMVHRPPGAFNFFEQETERYRQQLSRLQDRVAQHGRSEGVVAADLEKEIVLRRAGELEVIRQQTQAQIAETMQRIHALETQIASTPDRTTTEVRTAPARQTEQMQSTLLSLELKRIELLEAFLPTYQPVQEVEKQIGRIRAALQSAEESPLVEKTTDRNPTHDWLTAERAKSHSELVALRARAAATAEHLRFSREKARRLAQTGMVHQDLVREAKLAEENYLIYFRKREEARITDALDLQRIVNVAVAEAPAMPFEPAGPRRLLLLLLGGLVAGLLSVAAAFVMESHDPSFRTPDEVEAFLGIPVLAAMPRNAR